MKLPTKNKMSWFVLSIKSRNEKKAAGRLQELGITVYCPLVTESRQWSDRKKKVEVPLIPSYIFVQLDEKDRELVFQVPAVVRYLYWLGRPAIVRDKEIEILKKWLESGQLDTSMENLQPGDKIAIEQGPFKGKEGFVKVVSNNSLELLLLDLGVKIILTKQKGL